jgi:hypothetical protein
MQSSTAGPSEIDGDALNYNFYVERDDWTAWAATVPRQTALHERLATLIEQDCRATRAGGYDDMEERTARLLASRIAQRAENAIAALDDADEERARDELQSIREIAQQFEG